MKKRWLTLSLVLLLAAMVMGCGNPKVADISSYQDTKITIVGLKEKEFTVTPGELAELPLVHKTVSTVSKGRKVTAEGTGPKLKTFLAAYDVSIEDVKEILVVAADGYTKNFKGEFFVTHPDAMFSLSMGEEILWEEDQPMRFLIPGTTSDHWVKGIIRLEFTLK